MNLEMTHNEFADIVLSPTPVATKRIERLRSLFSSGCQIVIRKHEGPEVISACRDFETWFGKPGEIF